MLLLITLDDINDAYHAWQRASLLVEALHDHPNVTTKMIADAINDETRLFEAYTRLLDGYFTNWGEPNDTTRNT